MVAVVADMAPPSTEIELLGAPCGNLDTFVARSVSPYFPHSPLAPQRAFLLSNCLDALYGGAAGGGKSDTLLMAALQFVDVPKYSALILRKTFQDLNQAGALMDRARDWLAPTPAKWRAMSKTWWFPSGARITFGYCDNDNDVRQYQSAEYQFIAIDELTEHTEFVHDFLHSRLRRPALPCKVCRQPVRYEWVETSDGVEVEMWSHVNDGEYDHEPQPDEQEVADLGRADSDGLSIIDVPLRFRSGSNPGGIGHGWVKRTYVSPVTRARDVLFIPAHLEDNPYIDQKAYIAALKKVDPINWRRLAFGDWDITDAGVLFQRQWVLGEESNN